MSEWITYAMTLALWFAAGYKTGRNLEHKAWTKRIRNVAVPLSKESQNDCHC